MRADGVRSRMYILIVRTSSMGDLVHTLPAVSDIARRYPDAVIDWVVEEAFAEIPSWHPAVDRVIPVALRRWRRAWWSAPVRKERAAFIEQLRARKYDIIIDSQGLIKSALLVAARARGPVHGLDWSSAREPIASLFYRYRHRVRPMQPAVRRYRKLFGLSVGYRVEGEPDFALQRVLQEPLRPVELSPGRLWHPDEVPFAAIMPSASRPTKVWPIAHWQAVVHDLHERQLLPVLFAGNDEERDRAETIARAVPRALVLPRLPLLQTARILAESDIMVGLDSGITHLAAALGRPTIGIYCATPVVRTPITGPGPVASLGDRGKPPSLEEVLETMAGMLDERYPAGESQRSVASPRPAPATA